MDAKPNPWTLSPQATRNPNLWRGLIFALPLWEGNGYPLQIGSSTHKFASSNDGTWTTGDELGLAFTSTSQNATWSPVSDDDMTADEPLAMLVDVDVTSVDLTSGLLAHRSSFNPGYFGLGTSAGALSFFLYDGGFSTASSGFDISTDTGRHSYGVIRSVGGTYTFFRDGVQVGSTPTDSRIPGNGTHDLVLGQLQDGLTGNQVQGTYYGAYYWKSYAPNADDIMYLHNNPNSLFIPDLDMMPIIAGAANSTLAAVNPLTSKLGLLGVGI